ncbi:helix-turn-helix domain-containing protein [Bifidobacterium bifidum]|uniref:helix-turn-helix domain-containing protein n=1 Tax=Bifidobacterium bifidum TaxID=1681 RepID=UPI003890C457
MSNIALSWAFKCHVGNASAKAVLVYLADRADDDGTAAYPKIATIVNITELSERTVRTALKTLQERGFIRRGDQRYARLGKGGRNRLPQYCQIVWDLAVESDPSTLEWIKETHTAEHDPKTMGNTVDPAASTIMENGESKDVTPENAGTKPISSTANLAGLENDPEPALQISYLQHCESCTPSTANAAGLLYKNKTLQVNPPSKPSFPSAPTGHLPASGATAAEKTETEQSDEDDTEIAEAAGRVLASLGEQRSMLGLTTPSPTKADRKAIIGLYRRLVDQGAQWPTLVMVSAIGFAMNGDWWPKRIRTGRALARHWDELNDDMILAAGRTDGDAHVQTVPAAEPTEPDAAPWLPDWAVKTLAELDGQDATAGGEATA